MRPRGTFSALRKAVTFLLMGLSAMGAAQDGYRHTQDDPYVGVSTRNAGPIRMARISYIQGGANWRPNESVDWSTATPNIPLRQGAEIWVDSGGRAEIQFDDGSRLRLGSSAIAGFPTLFSDSDGEFTEIRINTGLAALTLTRKESMYQLDTPMMSVKATGMTKLRLGCGNDVEVAVRNGACQCEGSQGAVTLRQGDYLDVADSHTPFRIRDIPPADSWDNYCDSRDASFDHPCRYVPSNLAICAGDLDSYGVWRADPTYGHVWYPTATYSGWRPYHDGHWVWVEPFGWTWVADEAWGWTPYHYGSWIHASYGWGWCPGPRYQFWSPAVVGFGVYNGAVAWCPLSPSEILYPPFSLGLGLGNWFFSFGIGGAACYCPGANGQFCIARPWGNALANRSHGGFDVHRIAGIYSNRAFVSNRRFIPTYGRSSFAITRTTMAGFIGRGRFQTGTASDVSIFSRGHTLGAQKGTSPVFGPASVRPTAASITPSRSFFAAKPSGEAMERAVYRSPLPSAVAHASSPIGHTLTPSSRLAQATRTESSSGTRSSSDRSTGQVARRTGAGSKYSRYNSGSSSHSLGTGRYSDGNRYRSGSTGRTDESRSSSRYRRFERPPNGGSIGSLGHSRTSGLSSPRGRSPISHGAADSRGSGIRHRNRGG